MEKCNLCPRNCRVDRSKGERGLCGAGWNPKVALASLHQWEEPCLVGENGAGTVFFSHCNLQCVFCQNQEISQQHQGIEVSEERLIEIFLELQEKGAASIDLVTPTHYVPVIAAALKAAKKNGLTLPVVYNSNGYESEAAIEMLRGLIDIFLPDFKYIDEESACRYSAAPQYFRYASAAVAKMVELAGPPVFSGETLKRGVIVRHLILPGHAKESMRIVEWLWTTFGDRIYLSLMNQFTPLYKVEAYPEINRCLTTYEYDKVVDYAWDLGIRQCFIQEGRTSLEKFVPQFDGSGVKAAAR